MGPVFLVGAERSGTTLLRLMLDQHPELAFLHEFELAVALVGDGGRFPPLAEFHEYLENYRWAGFRFEIDRTITDYRALVRGMLEQKRARDGKRLLGATVHLHFDRLLHIWPEASFIKLVRDGRDVARSAIELGFAANVHAGIERWLEAERLWRKLETTLPAERRIEVKYEELVARPVEELTKICRWLGVEYSPRMLEYMNTEAGRNYGYPDPARSFQWKRKLSAREIRWIESRAAAALTAAGYPLSGLPALSVGAVEGALLRAHDRAGRVRFWFEALGPALWTELAIARRIGSKRWKRDVQARVNAAINRRLK